MRLIRWLVVLMFLQVLPAPAQGGEFPWKAGRRPAPGGGDSSG